MFTPDDLLIIGFLIFLEGILSIDNAMVLAILARGLPVNQQQKALRYGIVGAIFFRIIAIFLATYLIQWRWVKYVGGAYLIWVGGKNLIFGESHDEAKGGTTNFWKTVAVIELTDIAFAVDSILAAVALTPKTYLIITGGIIGMIVMRFAAGVFLKLLNRFPGFERTAYILVLLIGIKVIIEALHLPGLDFHSASHPAFWIFWGLMLLCIITGFIKPKPE